MFEYIKSYVHFIGIWIKTMFWHIGHLLMADPQYDDMSGSKFSIVSFGSVFTLSLFVKLLWVEDSTFGMAVFQFACASFTIILMSARKNTNPTLACALMGASTGINIVAIFAFLTLGAENNPTFILSIAEIFLYITCMRKFSKQHPQYRNGRMLGRNMKNKDQNEG